MSAPQIGKERPIIFSGPMVRAILNGRKTQTRRVIKPQPEHKQIHDWKGRRLYDGEHRLWWWTSQSWDLDFEMKKTLPYFCPYGRPGDKLWIREGFAYCPEAYKAGGVIYRADSEDDHVLSFEWRPSIHMPRRASWILLEITDGRIERVQEIAEEDAHAEGSYLGDCPCRANIPKRDWFDKMYTQTGCHIHGLEFKALWDSINKKRGYGWDVNPWVWVLMFRRIRP
jgi:hypothetical protein